MNFEIGNVLEYYIDNSKYRCMIVGHNYLNKNIVYILSESGNSIWNEDVNNLSIEYELVGYIDLSLMWRK